MGSDRVTSQVYGWCLPFRKGSSASQCCIFPPLLWHPPVGYPQKFLKYAGAPPMQLLMGEMVARRDEMRWERLWGVWSFQVQSFPPTLVPSSLVLLPRLGEDHSPLPWRASSMCDIIILNQSHTLNLSYLKGSLWRYNVGRDHAHYYGL